jgi:hypothetical protein
VRRHSLLKGVSLSKSHDHLTHSSDGTLMAGKLIVNNLFTCVEKSTIAATVHSCKIHSSCTFCEIQQNDLGGKDWQEN